MGTGTTGVAALSLGRKFLGFEKDRGLITGVVEPRLEAAAKQYMEKAGSEGYEPPAHKEKRKLAKKKEKEEEEEEQEEAEEEEVSATPAKKKRRLVNISQEL